VNSFSSAFSAGQHPTINNVLYYKNDPYRNCPPPYILIGMQCLFFSQPYLPWGMGETWEESYANYYDAATICRLKTKRPKNKKSISNNTSEKINFRGTIVMRFVCEFKRL